MGFSQIKVELCDHWGSDKNIANAAWASSLDKERAEGKDQKDVERVVSTLIKHKHDTPKERIWMEFFITCPIFIERQLDKYRLTYQEQSIEIDESKSLLDCLGDLLEQVKTRFPIMSKMIAPFTRWGITQNELSGRYRTIPDRPYRMPNDVNQIIARANGEASPSIRYYSSVWDDRGVTPTYSTILAEQHEFYQTELNSLRSAQEEGRITNVEYKRAREVLRGVLGTSYLTDMRIVLNLNAFEHIVNQRLHPDAQMESRVVAYLMVHQMLAKKVAEVAVSTMIQENGWSSWLSDVEDAIMKDVGYDNE